MYLAGRQFNLVKVGLMRAACPPVLECLPANKNVKAPVVIIGNKEALGRVEACSYIPQALVVSGHKKRLALYADSIVKSWAFMEASVPLKTDDTISCRELLTRLYRQICASVFGAMAKPVMNQCWPFVSQVFPLEGRCIYAHKDTEWEQRFELDPVERHVLLVGGPVAIGGARLITARDAKEVMPIVDTGARYQYAPPPANLQSYSLGGKRSELALGTLRNWRQVDEAVDMYVAYMRTGGRQGMRPAFSPVSVGANKLAASLQEKGLDFLDFVGWSADAQQQSKQTLDKLRKGAEAFKRRFAAEGVSEAGVRASNVS